LAETHNLCSRGHDKNKVGVVERGYCRECKRQLDARYYQRRKLQGRVSEWPDGKCKHGHVIAEVGVLEGGKCKACQTEYNRRYAMRKAREKAKANPNSVVHARYVPNLRQIREELGYTRSEFAAMCGLSKSVIEKIEIRNTRARPYVLNAIIPVIAREMARQKEEAYG
jgi:DNA-binding XRE family transcriptional regulator